MGIDKPISHGVRDLAPDFEFRFASSSGVPLYLQIVQQVESAIRLGYLAGGDQLPRVKDVVGNHAINPNTVLKAYKLLEGKGLIGGQPGRGTFVKVQPETDIRWPVKELRRRFIDGWLAEALSAGLDESSILSLSQSCITEAFRALDTVANESQHTGVA
jgi:GntR family transcriptional regulator